MVKEDVRFTLFDRASADFGHFGLTIWLIPMVGVRRRKDVPVSIMAGFTASPKYK
jgi:hypothetical protein